LKFSDEDIISCTQIISSTYLLLQSAPSKLKNTQEYKLGRKKNIYVIECWEVIEIVDIDTVPFMFKWVYDASSSSSSCCT